VEQLGLNFKNYNVSVEALFKNFFAMTGPDFLGHTHDDRAWFFHVKDHFF
jgi:hypothetical protein